MTAFRCMRDDSSTRQSYDPRYLDDLDQPRQQSGSDGCRAGLIYPALIDDPITLEFETDEPLSSVSGESCRQCVSRHQLDRLGDTGMGRSGR